DTSDLTLAGLVEFLAPSDFASHEEFGAGLYWMRARWRAGQYEVEPRLRRMLLNTVTAAQTVSIFDEVLGSSDAGKGQRFVATHTPVLAGERLEVREPEEPPAAERETIVAEEGPDAVRVLRDDTGRPLETWVRWHNVPDFYGSGPRDRHYVLDRLTGEIRFGDGLNGLIPPRGTGNLRLERYRTGGGTSGNRAAGTITQLKTTVPYIDKVTNVEPSAGGADAEARDSLTERAPRSIRHRDRAVTLEDYEDLAMLSSPDVARAKCVPLYNLAADGGAEIRLGTVSIIIVPRSGGAKPQPTFELTGRTRDFIAARRVPTGEVVVVGPEYVRVDVEATVGVAALEGAGEVEAEVLRALARYLHPLTGGFDGRGWDFGRRPHRSDLFALLESVTGVDYVHSLNIVEAEERAGAGQTDRFLVYSGAHKIDLTFNAD
ncbi:MAG TPA: putative baseplate assembly protein, partial [Pyrinomonadaceae bacterium]